MADPAFLWQSGKAQDDDLDLSRPLEVVVLSVKPPAARCRLAGTRRELTLRSRKVWDRVPGDILTVEGKKYWRYAGHPYLSGDVLTHRQEVTALDLVRLQLRDHGLWNPTEEYWGEEGEPVPEWAQPIIAQGQRPLYEMEQVIPGDDPHDEDGAIVRSADLKEAGACDGRRLVNEPQLRQPWQQPYNRKRGADSLWH